MDDTEIDNDVTVTIIGSAGTHSTAERVCSSYLISHGDTRLVLDMGPGALHNLSKVVDVADLTAVLISHLHPDHFLDLYGLHQALRGHPGSPGPVALYGPADMPERIGRLRKHEAMAGMAGSFDFHAVAPGQTIEVGQARTELFAMNHSEPCLGSRTKVAGRVIAFTGDTGPTDQILPLARNSDVFLCDSSFLERQRPLPPNRHNTGLEAGRAAASADVKRLVITHVWPHNDPHDVAAEAATAFDGEIIVATDMMEITL